ncbi:hypothetical protein N7481_002373 [Penicillium waksmanii]|uniref:uncharacterized protein n=1 Tax=Penicillium waksmanii TaxID=69791 RepID=UPI0025466806|nr:uncharacterized protein N7481_002373 [Penicillium waksmanii]KAJ5995396.1 hypothetical protein N7481_002373 [Penicillium waksmanii]
MSFLMPRIPKMAMVVLGLSVVASVYAQPIREAESTRVLGPRDPRIIPDTENYLVNILDSLGFGNPKTDTSTQATSTPTPTPTMTAEQDQPVNSVATPSSTGQGATFTTVIHNGNDRPTENVQIGSGWDGRKELRASDLPVIFDALYDYMESRFRNMVDSSDELGL